MNLQALCRSGADPSIVQAALRSRFTLQVDDRPGQVFTHQIVAQNDEGRIRLRLNCFYSNRLGGWVWLILPGDRP